MFDREKILFETDTEYGHYQVVDMVYEGRKARILFTGQRLAAFSGIPLDGNHDLLFDYIQRLFELASYTRPRSLLLLGGGTYTLPTALIQALPDIHIDAIEIDAGLNDIAEAFFNFDPGERIGVFNENGRYFLQESQSIYDIVMLDAFSHLEIPGELADAPTARLIYDHLSANGLVAINVISSVQGRRADTIERLRDIYGAVFDNVLIFPADNSASPWISQNLILLAQKGKRREHYGMRYPAIDL